MISRYQSVLLAGALLFSGPLLTSNLLAAADAPAQPAAGELLPVTKKEAAWADEARKHYPTTQCIVSGEALGSMGAADEYIYRVQGQPDRLVRFCCGGCEEDFMADPAAHLAKLDQARQSGGKTKKTGEAHHGH